LNLVLVDSDVLSNVMRGHPTATVKAREYLLEHRRLTLSVITRYEIRRGLEARGAMVQVRAFDALCSLCTLLSIDDACATRAAAIYATLRSKGCLIPDADILIAATALEHRLALATGNQRHFERIEGLSLEDWLS
jgi:tRNA(fMet)-specific endonuclease VapC